MIVASKRKILTGTLLAWIVLLVTIKVGIWLANAVPFLSGYSNTFTAILLLYAAFFLTRADDFAKPFWATDRASLGKAIKYFLIVGSVLPLIVFLDLASGRVLANFHLVSRSFGDWLLNGAHQFLVVAIPEEFFFRGYMQGQLSLVWPPKKRIFGVPFGKAQIITSLLFAMSHSFITFQGWHIFIFFPALLFAWLKEKTGTVWAGALFHAACNLFSWTLILGGDSLAARVGDVVSKMIVRFIPIY
jgi:membrane protease YdiL (CAAX protease family)